MSSYEKYDETSHHYDTTRVAVGSEIILGCLARQAVPLSEQVVLDAGCGTGAYSQAIVDHVGGIAALDMSEGMLDQASAKLASAEADGRIEFFRGSIAELPFEDGEFDAVMINQVIHHLADDEAAGFPLHRQVFSEFARVLRPGGALVVNSCSRNQLAEAFWYYRLIPQASLEMQRRFAPPEAIRGLLEDVGFSHRGNFVPVDAICQGADYFDGRGPLEKSWRDGDSVWALADAAELANALEKVHALGRDGELDAFVAAHDARRPQIGQITFISATRN